MNCVNDNTKMEKGFLTAHGQQWKKGNPSKLYKAFVGAPAIGTSIGVFAWRCPKCHELKVFTHK